MKNQHIEISGMTCGHCVMNVRKELNKIVGISVKEVKIGSADIEIDELKVSYKQINEAIEAAGYTIENIQESEK
ncbi:MAG: heavy-metal-associated domain-containing protein [Bacteroidota bacterium]